MQHSEPVVASHESHDPLEDSIGSRSPGTAEVRAQPADTPPVPTAMSSARTRPPMTLRRAWPVLVAAVLAASALVAPTPAGATGTTHQPEVRIVSPREAVTGRPFDVVVEVTAAGSPVTAVDVRLWSTLRVQQELSPACTATCTVVVPVDTTSWRGIERGVFDPLYFFGSELTVLATPLDGVEGGDTVVLPRLEAQPAVLRMATTPAWRDREKYTPPTSTVVDDELRLAVSGVDGSPLAARSVEARLTPRGSTVAVRTATAVPVPTTAGRWVVDDLVLPTADLPTGAYDVVVRASGEPDVHGRGERMAVDVNHPPYVTWHHGQAPRQVGEQLWVEADVRGPLPVRGPLTARLTVAPGGTTTGATTVVDLPVRTSGDQLMSTVTGGWAGFDASVVTAAEGTWRASWQLLDGSGAPVGPVSTMTYLVGGGATVTWATPTTQVGTSVDVLLTVAAPRGHVVDFCTLRVVSRDGSWRSSDYACPGSGGWPDLTTSVSVPSTGQYVVEGEYQMAQRTWSLPPLAVRTLTTTGIAVAVPDLEHGRVVEAVARVTSLPYGPRGQVLPVAGTGVTFQARWAGESSWRTVGQAVTGKDGGARLPVRPGRTGSWRAVTTYGADAGTPQVTSREDLSTVRAAARLTSLPARLGPGRTATFTGTVSPGALGPRAELQALAPGSRGWVVVARVPVASDGSVQGRAVLGTARGTWHVRLAQPGTATVATGASTASAVVVG